MNFNPRTREGCDKVFRAHEETGRNFNPRTREGCDGLQWKSPGKGCHISIHAPVKGATHQAGAVYFLVVYFNPRTREGCDLVSQVFRPKHGNFNPRTREGCDWKKRGFVRTSPGFQSTHP